MQHARSRAALALLTAGVTASVAGAVAVGPAGEERTAPPVQEPLLTKAYVDTLADVVGPAAVRVDRLTDIAATAPRRATTASRFVVDGVVKVRAGGRARPRPVRLVELTPTGWAQRAAVRSTRKGVFRFEVRAGGAARTRVFQVRAPRSDRLAATRSIRLPVRVLAPTITPPPVEPPTEPPTMPPTEPGGNGLPVRDPAHDSMLGATGDWTFLFTGGARWNPCRSIVWSYNSTGGYAGSLADVQHAFDRLSARTGLRFSYAGASSYVPYTGGTFPEKVDLALGWADRTQVPDLDGSTVGIGGGNVTGTRSGADVRYRFVRGEVVFDKGDLGQLRRGYDVSGRGTWGQVIVHEVMHALGLGHASGAEQVMYGSITSTNHRFGAGDLTGLTRIGSSAGCLS